MELMSVVTMYPNVCISGGEPLMDQLVQRTIAIVAYASSCKRNIYLYTNLSCWDEDHVTTEYKRRLVSEVTGWNIGYHPSQMTDYLFIEKLKRFLGYQPKNVRVMIEDVNLESMQAQLDAENIKVTIKTWKRDDCDHVYDKEDWALQNVILKEPMETMKIILIIVLK